MSNRDGSKRFSDGLVSAAILAAILLAVGGFAINWGYSKQVEYYRNADQNSAEYTRNTYAPEANRCLLRFVTSESQADCIAEASNKERNYRRDEQDLAAQKTSAIWAYLMGSAALIGMILSAFGVFLVWRTFSATREANLIAREIGEAQVRAYLSEEKTFFEWEGNLDQKFKASHVWKNSGQSPALNCLSFVDHVIVGFDEEETFIGSFTNLPSSQRVGHSCASGQRVNLEGQFIGIIDLNDLADKKKKLILYSAVAYVDVFKNKHLAESCHIAIFPDDGDAEKILFRTYRYHNGYTDVKS
jgi:hypothetical protein